MKQYLQVIKSTWEEYMTYRLNFVLWRVRVVIQILVVYFLWWAILSGRHELFGYTQSMILTYIILSSLVRSLILGTTTPEVGSLINQGDISNFLIRPIHFFRYYIARDIGDKLLNVAFSVGEIALLFWILRPPIFIQTDPTIVLFTCIALIIGTCLYFSFSMILSLLAFWTPDVWAPRFLSFVIMEFFTGGLFPLDILPKPLFFISQSLPFSYFIYFPLKLYLGQLDLMAMLYGLGIGLLWTGALWLGLHLLWRQGLRVYTAEGR